MNIEQMNKVRNPILKSGPAVLSMLISASIGLAPMAVLATTVNVQTVGDTEQTIDNSAGRGHDNPGSGNGWSDNVLSNPAFSKDRVNFPDLPGNAPVFTPPGSGFDVAAVPVPAAAWLFGSGLVGLIGMARRRKQ